MQIIPPDDFVSDKVATEGLAVLTNGLIVARGLGYRKPSGTQITGLDVVDVESGEVIFETEIAEGKYNSAIFVEWVCRYLDLPNDMQELAFDSVVSDLLCRFMGETVCADARNPTLDNHAFVRKLLNAQNGSLIHITWR